MSDLVRISKLRAGEHFTTSLTNRRGRVTDPGVYGAPMSVLVYLMPAWARKWDWGLRQRRNIAPEVLVRREEET